MRITNNMILHNAASNINSNKILVDKGENQMTTQTKIQRPSDDPVVAVRSLALQTRLSKINQYYETNIPDAEKWMDVTETALSNIIDNITDLKRLCVQGSTGTYKDDDKATIVQQLQSLQESIFAQGNADYAGRTVFTGYRTDKTLVFTDADSDKKYNITQELSANDFEKVKYFNHSVTVPANKDEVTNLDKDKKDDITIQDSSYKRLRLAYDNVSDVESLTFSYKDTSGGTVKTNFQLVQEDITRIPQLAKGGVKQADGKYKYTDNTSGTTELEYNENVTQTVKSASGSTNSVDYNYSQVGGTVTKTSGGTTTTTQAGTDITKTVDGQSSTVTQSDLPQTVYVFENESDWADWSSKNGDTAAAKLTKYVPDDAMVMIKETGDLIFGKNVSDQMSAKETTVAVNYDKNSFSAGELKPEYYYDCVDNTAVNYSDIDGTIGQRQVYDRTDTHYDINYTVAVNQTLTVNLQANEIFDSSAQQDMKDLIAAVTNAQNSDTKRQKIQALMKDADYQDEKTQAKLAEWYTAANKEYDYYKDYMKDSFERVLGNCDTYLNKANLGETTLGCRGDELKMTKLRMDEQQESVTDLKNQNDNMDLSTIMMNYTAYYTAYQASLVAAGKLGQQSLLNYI
ncbi:MAG: hypothetical protein II177_04750 [Lachnospiraceae bacterium]|nr:hypothetical protein [Lachnospiraceae bacterium]